MNSALHQLRVALASAAPAETQPVSLSDIPAAKPSIQYQPAIDGLRAVAVLSVFLFHLDHHWLPGGFVGVDIFFVISGYLITSILLREYERNHFSLAKFYQRRMARLFPSFFTVALATLIGAFFIYSPQDLASCGANLTSAVLSVANIKYMSQGNYFTISPDAQPFLHYWSLSVEEQFYMLFPVLLYLLSFKAKKFRIPVLLLAGAVSLLGCIAMTHVKPQWAFYLLPTRAWELLSGSILATFSSNAKASTNSKEASTWLPIAGLGIIFFSLWIINEHVAFPGYVAMLPVLGTVCLLAPQAGLTGLTGRLLSWSPLVQIGRMSYSLYLWHWPIFSLVDYKYYLAQPAERIVLKIFLTFAATASCFFFIENPGRIFFNDPCRRRTTFLLFGFILLMFASVGIAVRRANYIDADMDDVRQGGLRFNQSATNGSMVLMGDSNGSMYGRVSKQIAGQLGLKLSVISMAAGDPLPRASGPSPELWINSLAVVKQADPDFLLLVCSWEGKLRQDKTRVQLAVDEVKHYARHIILITQPPMLPDSANRESIRNGARPPFQENATERKARLASNLIVKSVRGDNVSVIDIEPLFCSKDGIIRFVDDRGQLLYNDSGHLTDRGSEIVKNYLLAAIVGAKTTEHR